MKITRRDILKLGGGAAIGVTLSPLPWKLLDDISIWTQNGSWIPKLPRGPVTWRRTTCALCPSACGVRARCVGGVPVALVAAHGPGAVRGAICPLGLAAHHLAYHPRRLTAPVARVSRGAAVRHEPVEAGAVVTVMADAVKEAALSGERIVLIDRRPGRAVSGFYAALAAALPGGAYVTTPCAEQRSLDMLAQVAGLPRGTLGYDLESTRTILSFGAPVLEDWVAPGLVARLRAASASSHRPQVFQVETRASRTAGLADRWLRIRPATEAALALGIARVIVSEGLGDAAALRAARADLGILDQVDLEEVARITGIGVEQIARTARDVALDRPSIAVGGGDAGGGPLPEQAEIAIAVVNFLLGSVGRPGGVVQRRLLPHPAGLEAAQPGPVMDLAALPDGSVRLLIDDGSAGGEILHRSLIARKLAARGTVVSFATHLTGAAARADFVVPAPLWLEWSEECPTPPAAARSSMAVTVPMTPAPGATSDPVQILSRMAEAAGIRITAPGDAVALIRGRVDRMVAEGRGMLINPDGAAIALAEAGSAEAVWKKMIEGARWLDDTVPPVEPARFDLPGLRPDGAGRLAAADRRRPLVLMPFGSRTTSGEGALPALTVKLTRETSLMPDSGVALMNPLTAGALGLKERCRAVIETAAGRLVTRIVFDRQALPGVAHVAVGPRSEQLGEDGIEDEDILSVCEPDQGGCWRAVAARIVEA